MRREGYSRRPAISGLRSRIEQELSARLARPEVLVCLPHGVEAVGAAGDRTDLAAGSALVQVLERLADQLVGIEHAMHQPEPDHRPRLAHQQAGLDLVRLAP